MYLTLRRWIAKYFRFESNSCVKNLPHFDTVYWFEVIFLMLLCKSKKVIRTKGIPFPESKLGSASAKENFHQLYSKHCFFSYSFSLKLSLVFICRENSRLSGILLFPDCPRFPECLGWTGSNLENRERFYFSDASQISAMAAIIPDKWKLRFVQSASLENTSDCCLESLAQEGRKNDMVFLVGFCLSRIEILALTSERTQMYWERRSISSCASMLLCKCCHICVQDSIFDALSISRQIHNREKLGQTSGDYPIYRQNLGWSAKSRIPTRLGFSQHMNLTIQTSEL